jgi:protein PsiE
MLETMRRLGTGANSLHRGMKDAADTFGALLVDAFHYLALFAIGATTVWSAAVAFVRYLIYVAITALGRVLIEIVGAEHRTGMDILVITGAILLLSFAVLVLRFGSYKYPSDQPAADLAR